VIVLLDNYDSFTYNLYQFIGEINPDIWVVRNDKITVGELEALPYTHLILSPGPGFPQSAGIMVEAIRKLYKKAPILGICLGHQAIGHAFGASVAHAPELVHGKASNVRLYDDPLFSGLPRVITAARYHSLIVRKETMPNELKLTAQTAKGELMGLRHRDHPVYGLQFHPESVLTPDGKQILKNFLSL
jgi:anthranilate synthase component 2